MTKRMISAGALALCLAGFGANASAGDARNGEKLFKRCASCHTTTGANRVGPGLGGIVGRPVGAAAGFKYSKALAGLGGAWTPDRLDAFLADPKAVAPGARMTLRVPDGGERSDLVAYLETLKGE